MEPTSVQRLARLLKGLVTAVFTLNLLCLPLVPGAVAFWHENESIWEWLSHDSGDGLFMVFIVFLGSLWGVFRISPAHTLWSFFFWLCGGCTAVILWQARRILDTILAGNPFRAENAKSMSRAAACCWVISGAALARLVVWLAAEGNLSPLFTYTALFVPAFFMAGLLFQVMSALFRQAAELKEDQDLTI